MKTTEQLLELIEEHISALELQGEPALLYAPIEYIMEDGGKRMRPLLLMLSSAIYTNHNTSQALDAAVALEVFHNFTLLHDDIMDKASVRRSRATVHVKWCENVAILSGDAMLILAYQILTRGSAPEKLSELLSVFNQAAMGVCQGQQRDMDFEKMETVSAEQYIDMIRLKTSVLMAAATKMGGIIGGATNLQCSALYDFGLNMGLAFQIQDDWLDTYGSSETFGKQIGGDIAVGKKTFLHIAALERGNTEQRQVIRKSRSLEQVRAVYDSLDISRVASQAIAHYFTMALSALEKCSNEPERLNGIRAYAESLIGRNK
ncbi:MAG: polyprenyl synthetase family protein [Mucinivorans sp.]